MRTPRQEAAAIPHSHTETPDGRWYVTLHHEDGPVKCDPAPTITDAVRNAQTTINQRFPGRTL